MKEAINKVLSGLEIKGKCIHAESHRHLAFYDIELEHESMVLQKLLRSANEIALHLRTKTIPIMKLVPDQGIVRMQVALKEAEPVALMDLYQGEMVPDMVFPFLLGEDDSGKKLWMDMNNNPHLLVAGASGSGKSTLLHTLIANALFLHALRVRNIWLFLADPKRVEFTEYGDKDLKEIIPSISNDYEGAIAQMEAVNDMMERRYLQMHDLKIRSIENNPQQFPLVLCIIDEVSDLIMQDKKTNVLQDLLIKVAQKGRAAGIFLILSTQRPSVDVITGLIKANFPGRIACKTASMKDSQVVLDRPGAETLLGRGDAVLQNMKNDSVRFQVAYTSPQTTIDNYKWLVNSI